MLSIIASNVPYKPEATGLANEIKVSRNDIPTYLLYMEKAGMIGQLRDETGGMRGLGKTEKVYLDNTNIIYALSGENANIGNVRETFFYNQTRLALDVTSSKVSDFSIGKYAQADIRFPPRASCILYRLFHPRHHRWRSRLESQSHLV